MDPSWESEFRARMQSFEVQRPPRDGEVPVSLKVRITSGCFHREHSPHAYALIDRKLASISSSKRSVLTFVEHESGPELLVYLALATAGVTLAKSVIDLIVAIVKARTDGITAGDRPNDPIEVIVRRVGDGDNFAEEAVLRIGHNDPIKPAEIEASINGALERLVSGDATTVNKRLEGARRWAVVMMNRETRTALIGAATVIAAAIIAVVFATPDNEGQSTVVMGDQLNQYNFNLGKAISPSDQKTIQRFDLGDPAIEITRSYDLVESGSRPVSLGNCPNAPCIHVTFGGAKIVPDAKITMLIGGEWNGISVPSSGFAFTVPIERGCGFTLQTGNADIVFEVVDDRVSSLRAVMASRRGTFAESGMMVKEVGCINADPAPAA